MSVIDRTLNFITGNKKYISAASITSVSMRLPR